MGGVTESVPSVPKKKKKAPSAVVQPNVTELPPVDTFMANNCHFMSCEVMELSLNLLNSDSYLPFLPN